MGERVTLGYRRAGAAGRGSRAARWWAAVGVVLPVVCAGLIYIEWGVAWAVLGRPPVPSLDDPKGIPVAQWLHGVTITGLLGVMPSGLAGFGLVVWHGVANRLSRRGAVAWFVALAAGWTVAVVLMTTDPGRVWYWWFD